MTSWYFWPCDPVTLIHDTLEVTARRIFLAVVFLAVLFVSD